MAVISKLYPGYYNGESEQSDELILDTQCRTMLNCVPSIITGIRRRNGTESVVDLNEISIASNKFHEYDRGEGVEQYVFVKTSDALNPIRIFNKLGVEKTVSYVDVGVANTYLSTVDDLKALTVQDRTFIVSRDKEVGQTTVTADDVDYTKIAYYWLSRSSNDTNNHYNYAVYIDGVTFEFASNKSDAAATGLAALITANANYTATAIGSIIQIARTDGAAFTFSYWDSWGSQASYGFKGIAGKLSDLPEDMPWDDVYVNITGDDNNDFNNYFVKYTGDGWTEWKDPESTRGMLNNMPIRVDRLANGTFEVDIMTWEEPHVGDEDTNPDPSFMGSTIEALYFYKNRLGFASGDNVVLSETGGYYNFYIKTVLNVLDTDPIDVAVASTKASKIYHVKPFQRGLYIFTADTQFEMVSEGALAPTTVSIVSVSNYAMDVDVEPIVSGTSLYFISKTGDNKSQLREYLKDEDSLISKGVDTTLSVPSLLPEISKIALNSTLGFIFCYSATTKNTIYVFKTESTGAERVQSAWSRWVFGFDIEGFYLFDTSLYLYKEDVADTRILELPILPIDGDKEDTIDAVVTVENFESSFKLPQWMPKIGELKSPIDNVQMKQATIHGIGSFNVSIYRKGYNTTITQTYASGELMNMSASILGRSDDVVITIKSNDKNDFRVESLTLSGSYTQSSKEVG